jgi:16S rRNA (guanine527-N7)-methyltransferase
MFHVEQYITAWFSGKGVIPSPEKIEKLSAFAGMVHEASSRFNLTGFKGLEEITHHLVLASLEPLLGLNVPRGTRAVDMGSGAGIPGVPLSIYHDHFDFRMIESHEKKSAFIRSVIDDLSISNAGVITGRGEEIGHNPGLRESFDFAFARAFSSTYITLELSLPLVRSGGFLYIFANDSFIASTPHPGLLSHLETLGAVPIHSDERSTLKLPAHGYAFKKISPTPPGFPRRYAVIKRESSRMPGES